MFTQMFPLVRRLLPILGAPLLTLFLVDHLNAQTAFQYGGGAYTEGFSDLPANSTSVDVAPSATPTINTTTYTLPTAPAAYSLSTALSSSAITDLTGWYALDPAKNVYGTDGGNQTTGGIYAFGYGASPSTSPALGIISTSTSGAGEVGVLLFNNTSTTFNQISLSYSAELWHQNTGAKTLNFGYSIGSSAVTLPTSGLTAVSALNSGSFTTGSATTTDLLAPVATNSVSDSAQSISNWAPGTYLWLTWTMNSTTGTSQGIGIGNLSFSAASVFPPANVTWNVTNGTWDTATGNWTGGNPVGNLYKDGDNATFSSTNGGTVTISSTLNPGSTTVSAASGTYIFSGTGSIGGSGSLAKSGGGALDLTGMSNGNSYGGGTNITGGTLIISNNNQLGAASGTLGLDTTGTLRLTGAINSNRALTIGTGGATIATGGNNLSNAGTTTINGTLSTTGAGNVALNGAVSIGSTGALNIGSGGSITLGPSSGTFGQTTGGTFNGNLIINGATRVNFDGGTFSGTGQIQVAASGGVISNTSGQTGGTINVPIVLNSNGGTFTPGDVTQATFAFGQFVTTIGGTSSGDGITVAGGISGNSDVNIANNASSGGGAGNLFLTTTASTYTGTTAIDTGGTIKLGLNNALPTGTNVIVNPQSKNNSTLDLNGFSQQVASLSDVAANVTSSNHLTITNNSNSADSTLTVGSSTTPFGSLGDTIIDGTNGHKVILVKNGSNALTLSGKNNTYSGGTTINGGTLVAANATGSSATGTGSVTVGGSSAAGTPTLAGAGFIGGLVTVNGASGGAAGHLSPGTSGAGTLTLNGGLTLSAGANLDYTLGTASTLATVSGAALMIGTGETLNVTKATGFATSTAYQLIHYSSLTDNSSNFAGWSATGAAGDTPTFSLDTTGDFVDVSFAPTPASQTTTAASATVGSPTTFPISFGAAVQWSVQNGGGSYAGFQSSVTGASGSGGGPLLTQSGGGALTATLLAGIDSGTFTTGSTTNVAESWRTRTQYETSPQEGGTPASPPLQYVGSYLISNVLNLSGMGSGSGEPNQTDPFVLQMQYNQSLLSNESAQAKKGTIYLGWLNPNGGGTGVPQWQKAFTGDFTNVLTGNGTVAGAAANGSDVTSQLGINFQGTFDAFLTAEESAHSADFPGSPTAANLTDAELALLLGAYGVDTGGHDVWAVVNHNSQFAVVPEPSSVALVLLGLAGFAGHRLRRRTRQFNH